MKIRTDFVTNSSSSSFMVEVKIHTRDGNTITKTYGSLDDEFGGDVTVEGNIQELLKATTVSELLDVLDISCESEYEDEEYEEEEGTNKSGDAEPASVTIKRSWLAWGEASSCFGANVDFYLPQLKELCNEVLSAEGDEKEKARQNLAAYLDDVGELEIEGNWGAQWPSNLCNAGGKTALNWKGFADTLDDLAEKVMADELPTDDYAEEIVTVDYDTKKSEARNNYFLKQPGYIGNAVLTAFHDMPDIGEAKEKIRQIIKAAGTELEIAEADRMLSTAEIIGTKEELMAWAEENIPVLGEVLGPYDLMDILYT